MCLDLVVSVECSPWNPCFFSTIKGYFGYTYPKGKETPEEFPCPASADTGSNSATNTTGDWFCTINKDSSKGPFPAGAIANCSGLPGMFGYYWSAGTR